MGFTIFLIILGLSSATLTIIIICILFSWTKEDKKPFKRIDFYRDFEMQNLLLELKREQAKSLILLKELKRLIRVLKCVIPSNTKF